MLFMRQFDVVAIWCIVTLIAEADMQADYHDPKAEIIAQIGLSSSTFDNPSVYIDTVRSGITGNVAKRILETFDVKRSVAASILQTQESNVARLYNRANIKGNVAEDLLQSLKVNLKALEVFEDKGLVSEWMDTAIPVLDGNTPNSLMDTCEGRSWIIATLDRIEFGEFS